MGNKPGGKSYSKKLKKLAIVLGGVDYSSACE